MKNIFTLALICLVFGKAGAQVVKPGLYVLSVGISKYKNSKYNLKYAHKDALDLAEAWRKQTDLYDVKEVKILINEQATRHNIRTALDSLKRKVSPSSFLVFIFSGHGLNGALVPYDFMYNDHTGTTITDLKEKLNAIRGNYIALLDACHSGSFAEILGGGGKDINEFQAEQHESMALLLRALEAPNKANLVIASSSSSEKSDECIPCENGYFTQCFLDLFDGKPVQERVTNPVTKQGSYQIIIQEPDVDNNGFVETYEMDKYIKEAVFYATKNNNISQNVISLPQRGYSFPIIRPTNSRVKGRPATSAPVFARNTPTDPIRTGERDGKSIALKITNLPNNQTKDSDLDGVPDVFDLCPDQLGELTSWGCITKSAQPSKWSQQQNGAIPLGAVQIGTGRSGNPRYLVRVGNSLGYIEKDSLSSKVAIEGAVISSNVYDVLTKGRFKWVSNDSWYNKYYYQSITVNDRSTEETIIRATYEGQVFPGKWRNFRKKSAAIQVGSAPEYKPKEFDFLIDEDAPIPVYTPTSTEQTILSRMGSGQAVYTTGPNLSTNPFPQSNSIMSETRLRMVEQELRSPNGVYTCRFQIDGNIVVYQNSRQPIWASQTNGKGAAIWAFQNDGNLVLYRANNSPVWDSKTNRGNQFAPYSLVMQDDGNLVIYDKSSQAIWKSGRN